jgi:hypothetical protein
MSRTIAVGIGSVYLAFGLLLQFILIVYGIGLLSAGLESHGIRAGAWVYIVDSIMLILVNLLALYEFKRGRVGSFWFGKPFFLVPRGIFLITYGTESQADVAANLRGFPVLPRVDQPPAPKRF